MKKIFRNLAFRKKVFILCLMVSLIPVIILGTYSYRQLKELLITREKTALQETLIQENNALTYKLDACINAMNHVLWDESFRNAMQTHYDNNFEMYLAYRDVIDPLLQTVRLLNRDFNRLILYTDNPIYPHGFVLKPLEQLAEYTWHERALTERKPFFVASPKERTLFLVSQLYIPNCDYTTILLCDMNYESIFHSMDSLFEQSYGLLLYTGEQEVVYEYHNFEESSNAYVLTLDQLLEQKDKPGFFNTYVVESAHNESGGWDILLYRPLDTILAATKELTTIVLAMIFCCVLCVIFLGNLLSQIIVRPLEMLIQNMNHIEKGDIAVSFTYDSNDEMGQLIRTFGDMVARLHHLVDEVLTGKIKQQEYEMQALQAQINPHFLYNSLSLINGKAILADQPEISRMSQLLSTFYRTTLNKGRNMTTVRDELANVRSYIEIQLLMHSDSFRVVYEIDESALSCQMIHLLLQPLVENAIMHGIDHIATGQPGLLSITCRADEELLQFHIRDNGPGIPQEKLPSILTSASSGYGIQNVHQRIQLFYGNAYGLAYDSAPGQGTGVSLTIPRKAEPETIPLQTP